ncbi:MAG: amidohydrolase family protein [Chloroflexota bacterium]|nr:amidohydrolase family protein [Chloroflexota bacterium]MDH5242668.1 amidohydrolase family protein [Chloroflexota bacterium]
MKLPTDPPFAIRARLLSPLAGGGTVHEPDGLVLVDGAGRIVYAGPSTGRPAATPTAMDLRPWIVMPGLVDLHVHLPQIPNAGLGAALDLLTWLDRYVFPLERGFDVAAAERVAPAAWRAMAAVGTTTAMVYGAVYEASLDTAFRTAEAHGIRAIIGKVMMDRVTYDPTIDPADILDRSLAESARLIERWHGAANGRLGYAVTPRFAVSCTADMLRESAALASSARTYWQTHVGEDRAEIAEVARLFPEAADYVDVYDRAGGLGPRTVLAHAVHLSDRELARLVETDTRVAHCPVSNLFLASGVMPLGRYVEAGLSLGLGSDVAGGPDLSIFSVMRVGFYAQNARAVAGLESGPMLSPLDWIRLGTLDGARALGLDAVIGSLEAGKEADLIAIDPAYVAPLEAQAPDDDPMDLASRLIFRAHPDMVRAAWVRGRRLAGPGSRA